MKGFLAAGAATISLGLVPALSLLTALAFGGASLACPTPNPVSDAGLAEKAPVPVSARKWVALTHLACPDLPTPWIAAVMAQESGFRPNAAAADRNGGTRGLFQLNASVWLQAYGAGWNADLDRNQVADIDDPVIHAATAGRYLCARLEGVRSIRSVHPEWASTRTLNELDALIIAHNAGEAWLRRYPTLPAVTRAFLDNVNDRATAWTDSKTTAPSSAGQGLGSVGPVCAPTPSGKSAAHGANRFGGGPGRRCCRCPACLRPRTGSDRLAPLV